MPKDQKHGHRDLSRMALWFVFAQYYPYIYESPFCHWNAILQEDNAAVKAEREKPEEKKTWQSGVKAWARKHGMTFDTLRALQFAGWLSLVIAFIFAFPMFRACRRSSSFVDGQSSLRCPCPRLLL